MFTSCRKKLSKRSTSNVTKELSHFNPVRINAGSDFCQPVCLWFIVRSRTAFEFKAMELTVSFITSKTRSINLRFFQMEAAVLKATFVMVFLSAATNQNPIDSTDTQLRLKRQFFNDYDGGIFYNGDFLGGQNTEAVQERQLKAQTHKKKPKRIKADPDFYRRLSLLQDTIGFSPFLRAYAKYFVRNREQKRERRDVADEAYYGNREDGGFDDYAEGGEYEEPPRHHFHPIPVF